jgi:hypothetical protein
VVMEKLGDFKVEVRQPRLFANLVGKVNEEPTRRRHDQESGEQRGTQPLARVARRVVQGPKTACTGLKRKGR